MKIFTQPDPKDAEANAERMKEEVEAKKAAQQEAAEIEMEKQIGNRATEHDNDDEDTGSFLAKVMQSQPLFGDKEK